MLTHVSEKRKFLLSMNPLAWLFFTVKRKKLKEKESLKMEHLSWKWRKTADLWGACWQLGNWAKAVPLKQQRTETDKGNRQEHASSNGQRQQPSRFCILPSNPRKTSWWNRARDEYQIQTLGLKNKKGQEGCPRRTWNGNNMHLQVGTVAGGHPIASWIHFPNSASVQQTACFPSPGDSALAIPLSRGTGFEFRLHLYYHPRQKNKNKQTQQFVSCLGVLICPA